MKNQRKQYWDDKYYHYWKERVKEANAFEIDKKSSLVSNDCLSSSDKNYAIALNLLSIKPNATVLEAGCGFGRSLPELYTQTDRIYAVDISETMVRMAKGENIHIPNITFIVSEVETTPFAGGFFDHIICFAVFDALYQENALIEMNRILKRGGQVLITGKNTNYRDDDDRAINAEQNARLKKHPNYFTDTAKLFGNLSKYGFTLVYGQFYLYRGDFSKSTFKKIQPEKFYEYTVVLRKIQNIVPGSAFSFSSPFSQTFMRRYPHANPQLST